MRIDARNVPRPLRRRRQPQDHAQQGQGVRSGRCSRHARPSTMCPGTLHHRSPSAGAGRQPPGTLGTNGSNRRSRAAVSPAGEVGRGAELRKARLTGVRFPVAAETLSAKLANLPETPGGTTRARGRGAVVGRGGRRGVRAFAGVRPARRRTPPGCGAALGLGRAGGAPARAAAVASAPVRARARWTPASAARALRTSC